MLGMALIFLHGLGYNIMNERKDKLMKLDGDKIVIESRYEIDDFQAMIDCYLKNGKPERVSKEELKKLRDKLDALYMCW